MRTYDPSEGKLILGISALNNWDSVRFGYEEDQVFHSSGTQGEVTRTINANKLGTYVITLPQSSTDNETLSNYKLTNAVIPCSFIDNNGTTKAIMSLGSVVKMADVENGKEAAQREWTVKGKFDYLYVGSNNLDVATVMGDS